MKIVSILSCVLILNMLEQISSEFQEEYAECRINNGKYSKYGITAEKVFRGGARLTGLNKYALFAGPDQDLWQFIPVESPSLELAVLNFFYYNKNKRLRNGKFGEYLFASNRFSGMNPLNLSKRRNIYTKHFDPSSDSIPADAFIWIFKPLPNDPGAFFILNQYYKEPLYAGSWAYKGMVFTWYKKQPEPRNKQFMWNLDCSFTNRKPF